MARWKPQSLEDMHKPFKGKWNGEIINEPDELPRYKALMNLCYGDIILDYFPDELGKVYCKEGEETVLYWPLRSYPDRIQLLISKNIIRPIQN